MTLVSRSLITALLVLVWGAFLVYVATMDNYAPTRSTPATRLHLPRQFEKCTCENEVLQ